MAHTETVIRKASYLINMSDAQAELLEKLSNLTGKTRADLLREAINALLGTYREVLQGGDADAK